ncbi:hypothetical protein KEM48_013302 [Puccinia striiformis f. sp. tritici PST-130]|nr:hypothetical protein KEM48_013302 [Puccinia striiformis f. sp. tritici PST-130]
MASSIQQLRSDIAKLRQLTLDIQNSKNINKNEHQEQQPSLSRDPRLKKSVTSNTIHRSATAPPPPPVTAPIVSATVPEQLHNSDPRYFHQPVHSSSRPTSHSHNRGGRSVGEEEEEEEEGVIKETKKNDFDLHLRNHSPVDLVNVRLPNYPRLARTTHKKKKKVEMKATVGGLITMRIIVWKSNIADTKKK